MSSEEIDTTQEDEIILPPKVKSKRTPAQLAVLASAREKAILVRKGNAELRKKEKDLVKMEKEEELRERREKLDRLLAAKGKKPASPKYQAVAPPAEEEEQEQEIIYKKKKKPRKQKIVYVSGSDSDEEEAQVIYKRKTKQAKATRFQEEGEPQAPQAPARPSVIYTQHGAVGTTRRFGT